MKRTSLKRMSVNPGTRLIAVALLVILAVLLGAAMRDGAGHRDPVTAAWERARAAGSYHFTADLVQVTTPSATIANVGRSSRTETLHLEGQSDLRTSSLETQIWSEGGSVLQKES